MKNIEKQKRLHFYNLWDLERHFSPQGDVKLNIIYEGALLTRYEVFVGTNLIGHLEGESLRAGYFFTKI